MHQSSKSALVLSLTIALLSGAPASATEPMDGESFDAYTRGKTLFYGQDGQAYGAEVYLDNRRVKWSFLDGLCKDGFWYEEAGQICFVYEGNPTPQCWAFSIDGGKLIAVFEDAPGATELYEAENVDAEMVCLAPNLGVQLLSPGIWWIGFMMNRTGSDVRILQVYS